MSAVRCVLPVVSIAGLVLSATTALAQTPSANPSTGPDHPQNTKPPSFSAAGVQGSTAPSGYSTGITREETSAVSQGVSGLTPELLKGYVANWPSQSCRMEPDLLAAVHSNPQAYEANHAMGLFYLEHGDFSRSVRHLEVARLSRPADDSNLHALVLALLGDKKTQQAIDLLQSAFTTSGQNAVLLRLLGLAYQTTGDQNQAVESYQRAIAASPDNGDNLLASGLGLILAGLPQQATVTFSSATARNPKDARLWLGFGIAQEIAGQKPAAVQSLLQAITIDRELAAAYFFLAALADASPQSAATIRMRLAEFAVANPSSAGAHYDYALALWLQRRINLADPPDGEIESQIELALKADPSMARAHYLLGLVYADGHDLLRAEQELSAAVNLEPGNADAHYHLAQDYQKTHDTELAVAETRKFQALRDKGNSDAPIPMTEPDLQSAGGDLLQRMALSAPCPRKP